MIWFYFLAMLVVYLATHTMLSAVCLLVCVLGLIMHLRETSTPDYQKATRAAKREWDEELACRKQLLLRLSARKKAMASVYWQQSRWQWLLYCGRTNHSQGRREVERYLALVEQRWADALTTQAPGPVIPPPPLPLSLAARP